MREKKMKNDTLKEVKELRMSQQFNFRVLWIGIILLFTITWGMMFFNVF